MTDYKFKAAAPEDAAALLEIYSPYVRETAITFEYDVPSEEEFAGRIRSILQRYPYIIAETGGKIAGYAYLPMTGRWKPRYTSPGIFAEKARAALFTPSWRKSCAL